jgi:hypothetical protein
MLLKEGFDIVKEGYFLGHIRSQAERIMTYIKQIEEIFNNTIFGDDDGPAQWALPYDHNTKNVAVICLDNKRIRKVLDYYEILCKKSVSPINIKR